MAININIPKPVIDYNDLDNKPTLVTAHSELTLDDGTNPHGTTASDVGLGNVDNTSDLNKPISTATQTALNGKQNVPIVVSSNITAENDRVYHVVANATFTDPTPVEGRGYFVVVRFASSCVLGGNSYIAGETIHRIFHSGSWLNIALRPSTYVPTTRTINGLNLAVDRTLTTANINDSTDRRYVTDAQSTVIGNTSGTNTGDQDLSGLVPYTGASGNVDLGEFGIDTGFVQFDTTPTNTPTTQGTLSWDTDDNTLQLVMNGSIMKVGEDQYYPVKNQTGVAIAKGTAVRFAGTVGSSGRLLIAPYIADGSVPNSVFMGVTSETIDDGEDGKVMWFGRIRGINTNAFNEGDVLYASPSVAGGFTTVPNNKVQVCAVVTKSINNGVIFVRPSIFPTASEVGAVPETRTINGLDLSANRTLTTADINDSANKRYVTDAQLTVIGNTSGTNTGDETNITILSKLNFFEYRNSENGTAVTGTTAEVIVDSILIPAGTFSSGSGFLNAIFKADKSGANAGWGMRLYIGPNNNNLTGATRIAINGLNTVTSYAPMRRTFDTTSTQLKGFPFSAQAITDDNSSTIAKSTLTVDWTINQYLMPVLILASGSDSCNLSSIHLKNF